MECVCDVVVVYEAVVDEEDVEICCCRGDGEMMARWDTERTDAGEVGERMCRGGARGERSRSDVGSGEVCLDSEGDGVGEGKPALPAFEAFDGGGRSGMAGRA